LEKIEIQSLERIMLRRGPEWTSSEINQLLPHLSNNHPIISTKVLLEIFNNPWCSLVLLEDVTQDRLAGMGLVFYQPRPEGYLAEIHSVVVHPDYRGQGLASVLVEALIKQVQYWAQQKNEPIPILLSANDQREKAIRLYLKHGFERISKSSRAGGTNFFRLEVTVY